MDARSKLIVVLFAVALTGIVGTALLVEWTNYRHGRTLISRRQFRLRLLESALIESILALMVLGTVFIRSWSRAGLALFWASLVVLLLCLFGFAAWDLSRVRRDNRERQNQLYGQFAEMLRDHAELLRQASREAQQRVDPTGDGTGKA